MPAKLQSNIESPHWTGALAFVAFVFCLVVNCVHFYLSKTSKTRQTLFGQRLIRWSHGSMVFIGLAPIFMIFSYVHPEKLFAESSCLCRQWYAFAVMSFATGLFLLKINYLVRLNMVLNPGRVKRCSPFLGVYLGILVAEMLIVLVIQFMVIDGECNSNGQYGCKASFAEWNGWLATGILIHDMILYYLFCVYFIRRVKGKLISKRTKDVQALKASVRATSVETSEQQSVGSNGSNAAGSASSTLSAGGAAVSLNMDSKASVQSNSIEASRALERKKQTLTRQKRKMALVYNGLIRQFRITLLAIALCAIDLVCNTIWMDYDMLWLFMLDCCAVSSLNFLAFRDSHYFVMNCFEVARRFGCESCSYLIDICCCMKDNSFEASKNGDDETTAASSSTSDSNDEYGNDDSFLRYDENELDDADQKPQKDEAGMEVTAASNH